MPASSSCMMRKNIEDNIRVDLTKTHRVFAYFVSLLEDEV